MPRPICLLPFALLAAFFTGCGTLAETSKPVKAEYVPFVITDSPTAATANIPSVLNPDESTVSTAGDCPGGVCPIDGKGGPVRKAAASVLGSGEPARRVLTAPVRFVRSVFGRRGRGGCG